MSTATSFATVDINNCRRRSDGLGRVVTGALQNHRPRCITKAWLNISLDLLVYALSIGKLLLLGNDPSLNTEYENPRVDYFFEIIKIPCIALI